MEKEKQKEKQSALCILPRMFVIYKGKPVLDCINFN